MTKRFVLIAGLVAALAGGSALALAQPGPGPRGQGFGPGVRRGGPAGDLGLRGVQLDESQREQVRSIMEANKAAFDEVRTKLRQAHRALAEAVQATPLDEATVRARSTDVANAMAEEAILRAKVRAEVVALLRPEQQEQLKQRQAERQQRKQQR